MDDLSKYIGRSYSKYNCFDLVKEFYLDQYKITLRDFFEGDVVPSRREIEFLIISNRGEFKEVHSPGYGDLVVIKLFGYSSHIGVCVGGGKFIHSLKGPGSCMENLGRYSNMIEGFYRHREHSCD